VAFKVNKLCKTYMSEGISRYFEGTLAQYISGSTEWINHFGGLIEFPSKFLCAKHCGDRLQDSGASTAFVKFSPTMGQKRKKFFSGIDLKTVCMRPNLKKINQRNNLIPNTCGIKR
jgi:hypothetical protein